MFNKYYKLWLKNELYPNIIFFNNAKIKNFILIEEDYRCSNCDISEYNNKKIILELDHINGDVSNNNKNNVRLLCPNCHSLTPTYKGKNKGNGKKHCRKQRYHEGKSY